MFAAIVPPELPHADLESFVEVRREVQSELRWTPAHLWHVTLAFMAEVPEYLVDDTIEAIAEVAGERAPIPLQLSGAGVFPSPDHARVVWMDVLSSAADGLAELEALALGVRRAVGRVGASPAGRRLSTPPHAGAVTPPVRGDALAARHGCVCRPVLDR